MLILRLIEVIKQKKKGWIYRKVLSSPVSIILEYVIEINILDNFFLYI